MRTRTLYIQSEHFLSSMKQFRVASVRLISPSISSNFLLWISQISKKKIWLGQQATVQMTWNLDALRIIFHILHCRSTASQDNNFYSELWKSVLIVPLAKKGLMASSGQIWPIINCFFLAKLFDCLINNQIGLCGFHRKHSQKTRL